MPELESPKTIRSVLEFAQQNGLQREEYFMPSSGASLDDLLWTPNTRWLAVYWVEGDSEGYYLHVDALTRVEGRHNLEAVHLITGKYWAKASAMMACNLLTSFVYGLHPI